MHQGWTFSCSRRAAFIHTPCKGQFCLIEAFGSPYLARIQEVIFPKAPSFQSTSAWGPPPGSPSSSAKNSGSEGSSKTFLPLQCETACGPRSTPYCKSDFALEGIQNSRCLVAIISRLPVSGETTTGPSTPTCNRDGLPPQCPGAPTKPASSRIIPPGGTALPLPTILSQFVLNKTSQTLEVLAPP